MLTLIGSRAMAEEFPTARKPAPDADWDWLSSTPTDDIVFASDTRNDVIVDERFDQWTWGDIASADELYTLKISHSFWEPNRSAAVWDKHFADILFMKRNGAEFIRPLYDILLPIWKDRFGKIRTNLNQNANMFFGDAVKRKYDHDSLHESVAYGERPLYESILKDGSEVMVDNAKFEALDLETKFKLVREEIYATALERIIIPNDYTGSPRAAYHWAFRRTATSLFKGEWALFLMLNAEELSKPDCNYVRRHLENIEKCIPLESE